MNRGQYFSSTKPSNKKANKASHFTPDPQGGDDWEIIPVANGLDSLSKEVFEETVPEHYDTGILDSKGSPILRTVERNGIGFTASIWWEDDE